MVGVFGGKADDVADSFSAYFLAVAWDVPVQEDAGQVKYSEVFLLFHLTCF